MDGAANGGYATPTVSFEVDPDVEERYAVAGGKSVVRPFGKRCGSGGISQSSKLDTGSNELLNARRCGPVGAVTYESKSVFPRASGAVAPLAGRNFKVKFTNNLTQPGWPNLCSAITG